MKLNHKYKVEADFNKMSKAEHTLFTVIYKLYNTTTEDTERLKKESLSISNLFNYTHTICHELANSPIAEIRIDEIWEEIKPLKGIKDQTNSLHLNRWYEATIIFSCVYVIIALEFPEKQNCLELIKSKCAYDNKTIAYFNLFEPISKLKKAETNNGSQTQEKQPEHVQDQTPNYASWLMEDFKKTISELSDRKKYNALLLKLRDEQKRETPNTLYILLLEQQVSYHRNQLSAEDLALPKEKSNSMIDVNHIIAAVEQYFQSDSIKMLQIVAYVLANQQYPNDVCEKVDAKINILKAVQQYSNVSTEKLENTEASLNKVPIKVKSVAIMEILKLSDKGKAYNDLTDICKLIEFITGNAFTKIYKDAQKGISFDTNYHDKDIDKANDLFKALNISISIDKQKQY